MKQSQLSTAPRQGWVSPAPIAIAVLAFCGAAMAQQAGFFLTGESPGTVNSWVRGFSIDGGLVVGSTDWPGGAIPREQAYRWTIQNGRIDATDAGLRQFNCFTSASSDGSVIVGYHYATPTGVNGQAFIIREGQPLFSIPVLAAYSTSLVEAKVSGDGLIVAGTCQRSSIPIEARGFRWTAATGTLAVPPARPGDTYSVVHAISRDGLTIIGDSANPAASLRDAFVWRSATGSRVLPSPLGGSAAYGVTANGTVIVGSYFTQEGERACFWDAQNQLHDLGNLDGSTDQVANCISDDGTIIAGEAGGHSASAREGVIWTASTGMVWARDYFAERGAPLPAGYRAYSCNQMSGDGKSFGVRVFPPSGASPNISGIAVVGPRCPADFNRDGGVDGMDVEAFFTDWADALPGADVNEDGGVDGVDVEYFFTGWEDGGC